MSTHNIGFYEEISFPLVLSSNTHFISSSDHKCVRPLLFSGRFFNMNCLDILLCLLSFNVY